MALTISVVILTRDRAEMLNACLSALRNQTRPADEIIVVDNGSTDSTATLLEGLARENDPRLPLRIVTGRSEGGWAGARNRGVQAANGDWVAFTDDDCLPTHNWLAELERCIGQGYEAIGGLVLPASKLRYPFWWHPEIAWAVGLSVPGHRTPLAGSVYYPQTANWATRRAILIEEPFQEIPADFDKDRDIYCAGREDAELWRRLRRKGCRTRFDTGLRVGHLIDPNRLRLRPLLKRAFLDGYAFHRREPHREILVKAINDIFCLPWRMGFDVWNKKQSPLREMARQIIWSKRQWGQCVAYRQRQGFIKGWAGLAWLFTRCAASHGMGMAKRVCRRGGILVKNFRRPQPGPMPPRRILVAANGYLGDMVLLYPFLNALKSQRPEIELTVLASPVGEALMRHDPAISRLISLPSPKHSETCHSVVSSALAASGAQLILVPYFHNLSPAALFSRPEARVVTFDRYVGFPRRWWYDRADACLAKPDGHHESENLYRLFHEAGLEGRVPHVPLAFEPDEVDAVSDFLHANELDRFNLVVIAPGSQRSEKLWPEERWVEVIQTLRRNYQLRVALNGSPTEIDMLRRIADAAGGEVFCWTHEVRSCALILGEARLVVGCDNGTIHLAAAMETPTLALFGPTDERQWGVRAHGKRHGVVRGCAWDLTDEERVGLPADHQMRCIGADQVLRALDEMLSER